MNKELLWDLFKKTGKIEYYIKYKKEENFRSQEDLVLDFSPLNQAAQDMKKYIKKIAVWKSPLFRSYENLPEGEDLDLISPITK